MFEGILDKASVRYAWLAANGYIDANGEADAYALDSGERHFEQWFLSITPIVDEINRLHQRIGHVNNGCRMCQKHFAEELKKCQIHPESAPR